MFRETCAEVFSECYYEGAGVQICETLDFASVGFMATIRSIYVPKGMVLKVDFNEGKAKEAVLVPFQDQKSNIHTTIYKNTIECIETVESSKQPRVHLSN